ncbi:MAG: GFA family protein [Beijerinckiaceae bacterium]
MPDVEPATYEGGCQCGRVRYRVELTLDRAHACNCSRCQKVGSLLAFAPIDKFELVSGEDEMTEYLFNKHVIHHYFCATCGVQSFSRGRGPGGAEMAAINVRCLDGVEPDDIPVKKVNGRAF